MNPKNPNPSPREKLDPSIVPLSAALLTSYSVMNNPGDARTLVAHLTLMLICAVFAYAQNRFF